MTEGPYPRFSDAEMARRHAAVAGLLDEQGLGGLLVMGGPGSPEIFWLSGYLPARPAWLLWPRRGEPVLLHHFFNHGPCIEAMTPIRDVRWYGPAAPPAVARALADRELGRGRVGVVGLGGAIPYGQFRALQGLLPEVEFVDCDPPYRWLRWVRSAEELEWLRRSARLTDAVCRTLAAEVRPGMSEQAVSALISRVAAAGGGQVQVGYLASTPMASPERCVPWQYPTGRVLQAGDVLITELTVSYWSYAAQIHRPFAVAARPTPLYQELFDVALECYERVRRALVPGATSEQVLAAAAVIEERGFTVFDSLLHGEAGRSPELGTRSSVHPFEPFTFRENMVLVIQPNPITPDRRAGLQLGAAVVVRPGGAECLHEFPFEFTVCG